MTIGEHEELRKEYQYETGRKYPVFEFVNNTEIADVEYVEYLEERYKKCKEMLIELDDKK